MLVHSLLQVLSGTPCGQGVEWSPLQSSVPSTIELPPVQVDPTCMTPDIFAERAGAFVCANGCRHLQIYAQGIMESCGVDESGTPCYELADTLDSAFI